MQRKDEIADRLHTWFHNGKYGMESLAKKQGMSPDVIKAINNWYFKGEARIDCIIEDIRKL